MTTETALDEDDIKLMNEALDAWVNRETLSNIAVLMVEGMLPPNPGESRDQQKARAIADHHKRQEKQDRQLELDKDRATLLKAKLIRMRGMLSLQKVGQPEGKTP